MAQSQNWPGITSAWLVPMFWPLGVFVILLIVRGANATSPDVGNLLQMALIFLGLIALTMPLLYLRRYIHVTFWKPQKNAYACPECGHDIHQTPHRCGACGAKLIWGHLVAESRMGRRPGG